MDPGGKESLVGINISDPGDQRLVEEGRLNRAPRLREAFCQLMRADRQGFRAHSAAAIQTFPKPPDSAEAARIAESQLSAGAEIDQQMRVRGLRSAGTLSDGQLAAHPQMNVELFPVVEGKNDAFSPAIDLLHRSSLQPGGEVDARWLDDVRPLEPNCENCISNDPGSQRVDYRLNFGKLWHPAELSKCQNRTCNALG